MLASEASGRWFNSSQQRSDSSSDLLEEFVTQGTLFLLLGELDEN